MALFGITRKKLEENFNSLVGNIGNLFSGITNPSAGINSINQGIRNVLRQPQRPAAPPPPAFRPASISVSPIRNIDFSASMRQPGGITRQPGIADMTKLDVKTELPTSLDISTKNITKAAQNMPTIRNTNNPNVKQVWTNEGGKGSYKNVVVNPEGYRQSVKQQLPGFLRNSFIGEQMARGAEAGIKNDLIGAAQSGWNIGQDIPKQIVFGLPAAQIAQSQTGIARMQGKPADFQTEYEKNLDVVRGGSAIGNRLADTGEAAAVISSLVGNENLAKDIRERAEDVRNFTEATNQKYDAKSGRAKTGQFAADVATGIATAVLPGGLPLIGAGAAGRVYSEMVKQGVDPKEAAKAASIYAPVEAALERIGAKGATKGADKMLRRLVSGYIKEGSTETTQELAENIIRKGYGDESIESVFEGVPESFLIGGAVGGGLNVAVGPKTAGAKKPVDVQQPSVQQPNILEAIPINQLDLGRQAGQQISTNTNPNEPQSIGDLLNNYNIPIQQTPQSDLKGQVTDLTTQYPKISQPVANRLIQQYGYPRIIGLTSEVQKSGTAKNLEAVVTSEAKKRFGTSNVSIQQPKPVQQPIQPITQEQFKNENLDSQDLNYISNYESNIRQEVENTLIPEFNNQPFTYEEMAKQIQKADRLGIGPDRQVAAFYKAKIKPFFDLLAEQSGKNIKSKEWYLPQFETNQKYKQVNIGGNLINQLDIDNFGFSTKRENKIALENLDYSPEGLIRYAVQAQSYRLRHKTRAKEIINEQSTQPQREGTKQIDLKQAEQAAINEEKIANKFIENSQEAGKLQSANVLGDLSKQGTLEGKAKLVIDKGPSWLTEKVTSSRDIYQNVPYESSFSGRNTNMHEGLGFNIYNNAEGVGNAIADITFKTNAQGSPTVTPTRQDIIITLVRQNGAVELDNDYKMRQYDKTADKILNIINNPQNVNSMAKIRHIYGKLQKTFGRAILYRELKTVDITNPILAKTVNRDAQRMLMQDNFVQATSEKVVNTVTGIYYKGALGYNPRSALMNIIELKRAVGLFGTNNARRAMREAAEDLNITKRYGVHETRFQDVGEYMAEVNTQDPTTLEKIERYSGIMWMFQKSEQLKDAVLLKGFESKGKKLGLSGTTLTNYVLDNFQKYAIKYGQFGSVGINKTKTGRLLFQFMQFSLKEGKINIDMMGQIFGKNRTTAQRKEATAYFRRVGITNVIQYAILGSLLGIGWEEVFGVFNPLRNAQLNRKIEDFGDLALTGVSVLPGGPAVDLMKDLVISISNEIDRAEQEEANFNASNVVDQTIKKDLALFAPGGNQFINKTGIQGLVGLGDVLPQGAIPEMQRGYNVSAGGRARFISPKNPADIGRSLIFGPYVTSEARKYFGNRIGSDLPFVGQFFKGEKQTPVSGRYQEQIDKGRSAEDVIKSSRATNKKLSNFLKNNPNYGGVYKEITKTTYNPNTKKRESDVISVDKWRLVNSDKSLQLFNFLKEKAFDNNKQFGDAIDPIFTLSDSEKIKTILQIRSTFTGDRIEQQEILRATQPWYRQYEELNRQYGKELATNFSSNTAYGPSERKARYFNVPYPEQSNLVKQYFDIKNKDANAAKEFYKTNVDQLSNDFDNYKQARLDYINKKRAIEGAPPIPASVFNNVTFGYEDDERKVYNELRYGRGFGSSYGGRRGGSRRVYIPRFNQPKIPRISRTPSTNVKRVGMGSQIAMRPGRVVVKNEKA